jgi:hypothetical protein
LPSTSDREEERDGYARAPDGLSGFGRYADSPCIFCSNTTKGRTAEQLYASSEWDYYYCYHCRGWFKQFYRDSKVFLPVREKSEIRFLIWYYGTQMQSSYEMRRMGNGVRTVWHFVEKHLRVPDQAVA